MTAGQRSFTQEDLDKKDSVIIFIVMEKAMLFERLYLMHCLNIKKVTSAEKYLNNTGERVYAKIAFQSESKFSIACENAFFDGCTTEKLGDPFFPFIWEFIRCRTIQQQGICQLS